MFPKHRQYQKLNFGLILLAGLAMLFIHSGCNGDGNGGNSGGSSGTRNLTMNLAMCTSYNVPVTAGSMVWAGEMTSQSATTGSSTPFNDSVAHPQQNASIDGYGCSNYSYHWNHLKTGLRPGIWRVSMTIGYDTSVCSVDLSSGSKTVNFKRGRPGCGEGLTYPG